MQLFRATRFAVQSRLAANGASRTFSSSSKDHEPNRGRTAGELGDDAAQSMQGAEGKAAGAGERVEDKVADGGFMPGSDAVLSPDTAGRAGGVGADVMGDMVDMMNAAVKGDDKRAAADVADMTRHQSSGVHTGSATAGSSPSEASSQHGSGSTDAPESA